MDQAIKLTDIASARLQNATKESTAWVAPFLINVTAVMISWMKAVQKNGQRDMVSFGLFPSKDVTLT